jgi:uncharacterized protein (TIGR02117 family)
VIRILKLFGGVLTAIVLALVLGSVIPRSGWVDASAAPTDTREVLLLSNPIHTDIALPLDDEVRAAFADLIPFGLPIGMPGVDYLVFGWGGRSFYIETPTWGDLKPLPVLRALTLDRSVMHVQVAGPDVDRFGRGAAADDCGDPREFRAGERRAGRDRRCCLWPG